MAKDCKEPRQKVDTIMEVAVPAALASRAKAKVVSPATSVAARATMHHSAPRNL